MTNQDKKKIKKRSIYPLHNWMESVIAVEKQDTNLHNVDSRTSQRTNGQSTRKSKAMLKRVDWKQNLLIYHHQKNQIQLKRKQKTTRRNMDGMESTINSTNPET